MLAVYLFKQTTVLVGCQTCEYDEWSDCCCHLFEALYTLTKQNGILDGTEEVRIEQAKPKEVNIYTASVSR